MEIRKFATLISYVTMIANRCGTQCLAKDDIDEIGKLVVDLMPVQTDVPPQQRNVVGEDDVDNLLRLMAAKEQKIDAIKAYRQITNAGLKEAKDAVERYW